MSDLKVGDWVHTTVAVVTSHTKEVPSYGEGQRRYTNKYRVQGRLIRSEYPSIVRTDTMLPAENHYDKSRPMVLFGIPIHKLRKGVINCDPRAIQLDE